MQAVEALVEKCCQYFVFFHEIRGLGHYYEFHCNNLESNAKVIILYGIMQFNDNKKLTLQSKSRFISKKWKIVHLYIL